MVLYRFKTGVNPKPSPSYGKQQRGLSSVQLVVGVHGLLDVAMLVAILSQVVATVCFMVARLLLGGCCEIPYVFANVLLGVWDGVTMWLFCYSSWSLWYP